MKGVHSTYDLELDGDHLRGFGSREIYLLAVEYQSKSILETKYKFIMRDTFFGVFFGHEN